MNGDTTRRWPGRQTQDGAFPGARGAWTPRRVTLPPSVSPTRCVTPSSSGTLTAAPASRNPRRRRRLASETRQRAVPKAHRAPKLEGIFKNVSSRPFTDEDTEGAFTPKRLQVAA